MRVHFRTAALLLCFLLAAVAAKAQAEAQQAQPAAPAAGDSAPAIVIAFVGGLFHHKVEHYMDAAEELRSRYGDRIVVEIVFNGGGDKKKALRAVHKWLDTDGDGKLSEAEKRSARIAVFGHSYGAPAELAFARELQREDIPVRLAIEIDDIDKFWESGRVIPANVAQAVNFYQTKGILRGRKTIVAADPTRTEILENTPIPYDATAVGICKDYSKFLRFINRYHIAIECNQEVWNKIEALIDKSLFSGTPQLTEAPEGEQGKGN